MFYNANFSFGVFFQCKLPWPPVIFVIKRLLREKLGGSQNETNNKNDKEVSCSAPKAAAKLSGEGWRRQSSTVCSEKRSNQANK